MTEHTTRVVVVGGGYVGVIAANHLRLHPGIDITLINPRPQFVERIRLHQLLTGSDDAVVDYAAVLGSGITLVTDTVTRIDGGAKQVHLRDGTPLPYDYLIYAVGSGSGGPTVAGGARVVVPDLLGFGRSDKPVDDSFYTFDRHSNTIIDLIQRLELRNITLVVQDWGGLLGLTLPVEPDIRTRIARLIVMNTAIAVGEPLGPGFDAWRAYAGSTQDMSVGKLLLRSQPGLTAAEAAAYDAPFENSDFKAGVRMFPKLVMTEPGMGGVETSRRAAKFWKEEWQGPMFMACGATDPVFGPDHMRSLANKIKGCPEPMMIADAGHFVQERGDIVAAAALAHFDGTMNAS